MVLLQQTHKQAQIRALIEGRARAMGLVQRVDDT
jgi:hypothetical protein